MKRKPYPTAVELSDVFRLDRLTGRLYLKKSRYGAYVGREVGTMSGCGYLYVAWRWGDQTRNLLAHRVVWMLFNGLDIPEGMVIDHVNGCVTDNRPNNLRLATKSQNAFNRGRNANGSSGHKGVSWDKYARLWTARIGSNGDVHFLGYFKKMEDAAAAYNNAAARLHGDFVHSSVTNPPTR